jgi:hypothetical protein
LTFPDLETGEDPDFEHDRRDHDLLDELRHLGDSVFNWNRAICTVQVKEVDLIDSQPRQRPVKGLMNVFRVAIYRPTAPYTRSTTELGSKEDLAALSGLLEPSWVVTVSDVEL